MVWAGSQGRAKHGQLLPYALCPPAATAAHAAPPSRQARPAPPAGKPYNVCVPDAALPYAYCASKYAIPADPKNVRRPAESAAGGGSAACCPCAALLALHRWQLALGVL